MGIGLLNFWEHVKKKNYEKVQHDLNSMFQIGIGLGRKQIIETLRFNGFTREDFIKYGLKAFMNECDTSMYEEYEEEE